MKRKVWDITVKDNPNRVVMGENDEFYTTDTEAYLVFQLDDENFNPATAVLTLENRNNGSLKNEKVDVVDGLIEWEMPQRYIEHFGNWQGQLIYEDTKDGQPGSYTSGQFTFVVNAHIGDKKKPSLVEIENWQKFIRDGTELIETWEDLEALREENERQRQENEQGRESAESERVANEAERITKDSERDSKIDSKTDKSMLLSPKYDLVYDSCVRDVNTPLDAYSVPMESGHYFVNVDERETDTILTYEPEGVVLVNPASNNSFSPVLIEDFEVDFPYINARFNNVSLSHVNRSFYIKYLNKQNWIRVNAGTNITVITTCIDGVETEIVRQSNPLNNDFGERYGLVQDVHISYRQVHTLASPSGKAVVVRQNDRESFVVGVPIEVANLFDKQGKVGFDVWGRTEILNFKAGRVR